MALRFKVWLAYYLRSRIAGFAVKIATFPRQYLRENESSQANVAEKYLK
jgi:hypothetical protein